MIMELPRRGRQNNKGQWPQIAAWEVSCGEKLVPGEVVQYWNGMHTGPLLGSVMSLCSQVLKISSLVFFIDWLPVASPVWLPGIHSSQYFYDSVYISMSFCFMSSRICHI